VAGACGGTTGRGAWGESPAGRKAATSDARPAGLTATSVLPPSAPGLGVSRAITILTWLVFAISFLKGLRMPSLWSATHFTFNYSHGFVRRGFVGELLRRIGGDHAFSYRSLALLSFVLLVAAVVVMALLLRRTLRADPEDLGLRVAILAFAASPSVVFFVHMIGYLDYLGVVAVAFLLLFCARSTSQYAIFYCALPIGIVLALIHESLPVMFAPVMFFAMLCHIVNRNRERTLARRANGIMVAHALLFTGLVLVASGVVGTLGTRPVRVVKSMELSVAEQADFPLRPDALEVLRRSPGHMALRVMPSYYGRPGTATQFLKQALVALPGYAFLVYYGLQSVGRLGLSRRMALLLRCTFVGAAVSPLSLNLVGWDHGRWNSVAMIATMLCIAALKVLPPGPAIAEGQARHQRPSPILLTLGGAAIALGLSADNVLFDGYTVQLFPFEKTAAYFIEAFREGFRIIPEH